MSEIINIPSYAEQARACWRAAQNPDRLEFARKSAEILEAAGHTCHKADRKEAALAAAAEILRRLADDSVPLDDGTLAHDAATWIKLYA